MEHEQSSTKDETPKSVENKNIKEKSASQQPTRKRRLSIGTEKMEYGKKQKKIELEEKEEQNTTKSVSDRMHSILSKCYDTTALLTAVHVINAEKKGTVSIKQLIKFYKGYKLRQFQLKNKWDKLSMYGKGRCLAPSIIKQAVLKLIKDGFIEIKETSHYSYLLVTAKAKPYIITENLEKYFDSRIFKEKKEENDKNEKAVTPPNIPSTTASTSFAKKSETAVQQESKEVKNRKTLQNVASSILSTSFAKNSEEAPVQQESKKLFPIFYKNSEKNVGDVTTGGNKSRGGRKETGKPIKRKNENQQP